MASNNRDITARIRAKDETASGVRSAENNLKRLAAAQKRTQARRDQYAAAVQATRDLSNAYDEAATASEALGRKMDAAARPSKKLRAEFDASRQAARDAKKAYLEAGDALSKASGRRVGGFAAVDAAAQRAAPVAPALQPAQLNQSAAAARSLGDALDKIGRFEHSTKDQQAALQTAAAFRAEAIAADELAAAERSLIAMQRSGEASADQLVAAHRRLADAYQGVETAAASAAAVQKRVGKGDLAGSVVGAWSSRKGRGPLGLRPYELTNLGYQVNDLVTQIASGTSPMQAFAQQGGQIAQIFPKATGALLRMSPVLIAIGVAISPLLVAFKQLNDEATRLSGVDTALKTSGNAADYSRVQLADYAKTLQDMGVKAEDTAGVIRSNLRDAVDPAYLTRFATAARGLSKVTGEELTTSIETVSQAFTGNADEVLALDDQLGFLSKSERKHIEQLRESKRDAEARTEAFAIFERKYGEIGAKMDGPWSQILSNFGDAWGAFGRLLLDKIQWDEIKNQIGGILAMIAELTALLPGVRRSEIETRQARHANLDRQIRLLEDRPDGAGTDGRGWGETVGQRRTRLLAERDANQRALVAARQREAAKVEEPKDTTTRPPRAANTSTSTGGDRGAERRAEQQAEFLASLEAENAAREFQLSLISKAGREQEILAAIREKSLAAEAVGLELTADQVSEIERTTGALYDARKAQEANQLIEQARLELAQARGEVEDRAAYISRMTATQMAEASAEQKAAYAVILGQMWEIEASQRRRAELEQAISNQEAIRSELLAQLDAAVATGDQTRVAQIEQQLVGVNANLLTAIDNMIAFWSATGGPEADAALLKLNGLRTALQTTGQSVMVTGKQIDDMIVDGGANAIDQFAQAVANGENAFDAMRDAFLQFAGDFLRQIAMMIAQQAILNALGGGSGKGSKAGGGIAGFLNGLFGSKHTGGLVGSGGMFRSVNPAVFAGAQRYHTGGLVGLAPNEVPIIAKRNEEVLTETDPRHSFNGGGAGARSVKVTNVFDTGDILSKGLASEAGEQAFWNFVRANSEQFKANLG